MDFVTRFVEYTKMYESPTSFWKWSAYALISAIIRDNVFLQQGFRFTYPNMYVVLLADSAEYRKSGSFPLVVQLLNILKVTKVIKGRASIQAILEELSHDTGVKGLNGNSLKGGSCILLAEELASFFVKDPALIPMITDIYDYRDEWDYSLKGSGKTVVKKLCVTMLAASNEMFLREVYTSTAVYGGLLGRTFMIKPDERRPPNSLWEDTLPPATHIDELVKDLLAISNLKGVATATKEAKQIYDIWYHELYDSYKKYKDRTGVIQRMHTSVLKLAMILAASHEALEINEHHMTEAISEVIKLKANYEVYAMSSGKSTQAEIGATFLKALWDTPDHKASKQELLRKHWNDFSAEDLDKLVDTLTQAKLIDLELGSSGNVIYKMTEKCVEFYLKKV